MVQQKPIIILEWIRIYNPDINNYQWKVKERRESHDRNLLPH